jgi:hypothetical protein
MQTPPECTMFHGRYTSSGMGIASAVSPSHPRCHDSSLRNDTPFSSACRRTQRGSATPQASHPTCRRTYDTVSSQLSHTPSHDLTHIRRLIHHMLRTRLRASLLALGTSVLVSLSACQLPHLISHFIHYATLTSKQNWYRFLQSSHSTMATLEPGLAATLATSAALWTVEPDVADTRSVKASVRTRVSFIVSLLFLLMWYRNRCGFGGFPKEYVEGRYWPRLETKGERRLAYKRRMLGDRSK